LHRIVFKILNVSCFVIGLIWNIVIMVIENINKYWKFLFISTKKNIKGLEIQFMIQDIKGWGDPDDLVV